MAAGMAVGVAAPAVVAVGLGYDAYKLAQQNDSVRDGLTRIGNVGGGLAARGAQTANQAVENISPVAKDLAEIAGILAKRGLGSVLSSVEAGAARLKKRLETDKD